MTTPKTLGLLIPISGKKETHEIIQSRGNAIHVENEKGNGFELCVNDDGSFSIHGSGSLSIDLNSGNAFSFRLRN